MANNNFFLSQDPLLFQNPYSQRFSEDKQSDAQMRQRLNDAYLQYKNTQDELNANDYIGELDSAMTNLPENVVEKLSGNEEYLELNRQLQGIIQKEIMASVKWRINTNPSAVRMARRQKDIIDSAVKEAENEEKQNISELNDYMKNYADMTFNEYRQAKQKSTQK